MLTISLEWNHFCKFNRTSKEGGKSGTFVTTEMFLPRGNKFQRGLCGVEEWKHATTTVEEEHCRIFTLVLERARGIEC